MEERPEPGALAVTFRGTRTFDSLRAVLPAAAVQELDRFAEALHTKLAQIDEGTARRWKWLPVERGATAAPAYDYVLPLEPTVSAVTVALPVANPENQGRELGILRREATALVEIVSSGGLVDGATAVVSLPATRGLYVYVADHEGHWRRR